MLLDAENMLQKEKIRNKSPISRTAVDSGDNKSRFSCDSFGMS